MSLNRLLASDRLRPLLEGVIENMKPAAVSVAGGNGTTSLDITPAIKVRSDIGNADPVKTIVDALIETGGGDLAAPIADTIEFDNGGLYFVAAGSARDDEINYTNTRTDPDAPALYLDARDGDDVINVKSGRGMPPPFGAPPGPPGAEGGESSKSVRVLAGGGNDRAKVEAAYAEEVLGGDGDDLLGVRAGTAGVVDGGTGNDEISVFARDVLGVFGGDGDDAIVARAEVIGAVDGGAGDDDIIVSSRNYSFARGIPEKIVPQVSGGTGNDRMMILGEAEVSFAAGDGNDSVSISATTTFRLGEGLSLDGATIEQDGNRLTITFGDTGDSIAIESRTGTLQLVANDDGSFTAFTSEEASAAALAATAIPDPLADAVSYTIDRGTIDGESNLAGTLDRPTFVKLGPGLDLAGATFERSGNGLLITFSTGDTFRMDAPDGGDVLYDEIGRDGIAFFSSLDQLEAWRSSPANPANADPRSDDPFVSFMLKAHEHALFDPDVA